MDGSNGSDGHTRGGDPRREGRTESRAHADPPDLPALARDWIELWQSEVTALAADPETAETWARLAALWAGAAASGIAAMPRGVPGDAGFPFQAPWPASWPAQPPRPAAAAAAPDAGGDAPRRGARGHDGSDDAGRDDAGGAAIEPLLERVLDRLAAIERRLAALEQRGLDEQPGPGKGGDDRRRPRGGRDRPGD